MLVTFNVDLFKVQTIDLIFYLKATLETENRRFYKF